MATVIDSTNSVLKLCFFIGGNIKHSWSFIHKYLYTTKAYLKSILPASIIQYLLGTKAMIDKMLIETVLTGKILLIIGWLCFLYKTARTGRPKWALLGVLYIGAISVIFEMLPLEVGYSLPCAGCDRAAYVGQAMTYAVGNPFGEDFAYQGIQTMYSPIYPYIVAIVHWITGFDVIRIYDYGAAIAVVILALLFYYFGCPRDPINSPDKKEIQWVGALMAFFFLYMSTTPVRWQDHYAAFWNTLILLKPGHVLSFFFLPILYYFMSKRFKWYYMLVAGIALGAMVPTFIVTAVFITCGLFVYLVLVYLFDKINFTKEIIKTFSVGVIGMIFSIWYWLPIFTRGFKIGGSEMQGSVPTTYLGDALVVFDPFEATFFMLPLFWLGIIGMIVMLNRRRKGDLLILGLIIAMCLGKFIYPFSWVLFNFAPQAWECSMFFLKPAMAMAASIGVYTIVGYILRNYEKIKGFILNQSFFEFASKVVKIVPSHMTWNRDGTVIACCLLMLTPYATPVWHNPFFNDWWGDRGVPLPEDVVEYSDWIKENTPYNAVFLTDGDTSTTISTYTGRKLMRDRDGRSAIVDFQQKLKDANTIFTSQDDDEIKLLIDKYNIRYIMITGDTLREYPDIRSDTFYNNRHFIVVYCNENVAIFKVAREKL